MCRTTLHVATSTPPMGTRARSTITASLRIDLRRRRPGADGRAVRASRVQSLWRPCCSASEQGSSTSSRRVSSRWMSVASPLFSLLLWHSCVCVWMCARGGRSAGPSRRSCFRRGSARCSSRRALPSGAPPQSRHRMPDGSHMHVDMYMLLLLPVLAPHARVCVRIASLASGSAFAPVTLPLSSVISGAALPLPLDPGAVLSVSGEGEDACVRRGRGAVRRALRLGACAARPRSDGRGARAVLRAPAPAPQRARSTRSRPCARQAWRRRRTRRAPMATRRAACAARATPRPHSTAACSATTGTTWTATRRRSAAPPSRTIGTAARASSSTARRRATPKGGGRRYCAPHTPTPWSGMHHAVAMLARACVLVVWR
jgi:hypothetical protein